LDTVGLEGGVENRRSVDRFVKKAIEAERRGWRVHNDCPVLASPDGSNNRTEGGVAAKVGPTAMRFVDVDAWYAVQQKVGRETVWARPARKKVKNRTKRGQRDGRAQGSGGGERKKVRGWRLERDGGWR